MYALRVLGGRVRLAVAADDLVLPAALAVLWRTVWLIVGALQASAVEQEAELLEECRDAAFVSLARGFALAVLAVGTVSFGVFLAGYMVASRGKILEPSRRAAMPTLIDVSLAVAAAQLAVACVGAAVVAQWPSATAAECADAASRGLAVASVALLWLDLLTYVGFACVVVNRAKPVSTEIASLRMVDEWELAALRFQSRCRTWCMVSHCCSCGFYGYAVRHGNEIEHSYAEVGEVLATFFAGLKLTPMELLAAASLLRAQQRSLLKGSDGPTLASALSIRVDPVFDHVNGDGDGDGEGDDEAPQAGKLAAQPRMAASGRSGSSIEIHAKEEQFPSAHRDDDAELRRTMDDFHAVLRYTEAINSYKLLLMQRWLERKPLKAARELLGNAMRHARHRQRERAAHTGDNCCAWNSTAFVALAELPLEDLVYSRFVSYAGELVAFAVAVDRKARKVVLVFRGSLALADFLTDAALTPQHLHGCGQRWGFDGAGHYAHGGMLSAAEKIRESLAETGVLHKLYRMPVPAPPRRQRRRPGSEEEEEAAAEAAAAAEDMETGSQAAMPDEQLPDCRGFQLVVAGESLGAGIAAIESLLLRAEFPDLQGFGVSTPGCIFSEALADQVSPYFKSLTVGKDLVSRANWQSLARFRREALDCLARSNVHKLTALRSLFHKNPDVRKLMYGPSEVIPDNPEVARVRAMLKHCEELSNRSGNHISGVPLFCPGTIVHLAKIQTIYAPGPVPCFPKRKRRSYKPTFVRNRGDLACFVISPRMVLDHMPHVVRAAVEDVVDYA